MRKYFLFILCILLLCCKTRSKKVDTEKIIYNPSFEHFDEKVFSIDTNNTVSQLAELFKKNNYETSIFSEMIGLLPTVAPELMAQATNEFIKIHRNAFDTSKILFNNQQIEKQCVNSFKHLKFYFPNLPMPQKLIGYMAPLTLEQSFEYDSTNNSFWVPKHLLLTPNFSLYNTEEVSQKYPFYVRERFSINHLGLRVTEKMLDYFYPYQANDQTLANQMIEKGKRLYILQACNPDAKDFEVFYTTEPKMKWCKKFERGIWDHFIQNNSLQMRDKIVIANYIGENAKTMEFGDESPGRIGQFCGWQMIKIYMDKNPNVSFEELLKTDPNKIFQEVRYKP